MKNLFSICLVTAVLLSGCAQEQKAQSDARSNPQEMIGKTFDLNLSVVGGYSTPDAAWNRAMKRRTSSYPVIITAESDGSAPTGKEPKLRVRVLSAYKQNTDCPVFQVKALNKKYCGSNWWVTYKDFKKSILITDENRNEKHPYLSEKQQKEVEPYLEGIKRVFPKQQ